VQSLAPSDIDLAKRPKAAGTQGKAVRLATNFFRVNYSSVPPIMHHDVRIERMRFDPETGAFFTIFLIVLLYGFLGDASFRLQALLHNGVRLVCMCLEHRVGVHLKSTPAIKFLCGIAMFSLGADPCGGDSVVIHSVRSNIHQKRNNVLFEQQDHAQMRTFQGCLCH
jgi:hypothetical protein